MIANKEYVINKLNELSLYAKKNFGQNFLVNDDISKKIVSALDIKENDTILEIGPGLGALSYHLSLYENDVYLYDIDEDMVNHLNKVFSNKRNVKVIGVVATIFLFILVIIGFLTMGKPSYATLLESLPSSFTSKLGKNPKCTICHS